LRIAGEDNRFRVGPQKVDEEGRFLQRVRSLGNDDAGCSALHCLGCRVDEVEHLGEGQTGARHGFDVVDLDLNIQIGEARNRSCEVSAAEPRYDAGAARGSCH
jgi:hypothetical protein